MISVVNFLLLNPPAINDPVRTNSIATSRRTGLMEVTKRDLRRESKKAAKIRWRPSRRTLAMSYFYHSAYAIVLQEIIIWLS